jgi:hypothetical protein
VVERFELVMRRLNSAPWHLALCWTLMAIVASSAGSAFAQPAEKRVALVIGNSAYRHTERLANPRNDATDVAAALRSAGFEVTEGLDLDKEGMDRELARFARSAADASAAVVFYAGHGLQYQGQNYLVPVDAALEDEIGIRFETTSIDDLMSAFVRVSGVQILILDACRNNPLAGRLADRHVEVGKGLSRISSPRGMLVASATQANELAFDGSGRNSFFSGALVEQLKVPGLEAHEVFRRVAATVNEETKGKQLPETSSSLAAPFYFNPGETDQQAWSKLRDSMDVEQLRGFVARYPDSLLVDAAKARIDLAERIASEKDLQKQLAQAGQPPRDAEPGDTAAAVAAQPTRKPAETRVAGLQSSDAPQDSGRIGKETAPADLRVKEAQTELGRLGCFKGAANGVFDEATREALASYRSQFGKVARDGVQAVDDALLRDLRESKGANCQVAKIEAPPTASEPAAGVSCDELLERAQLGDSTDDLRALIQQACQ